MRPSATSLRRAAMAIASAVLAISAAGAEDWQLTRTELNRYINRTLNQALRDSESGRLAEALQGWQILDAIEPGNPLYSERLRSTRASVQARVTTLVSEAARLSERAKRDEAIALLLDALSLDPTNAQIAATLRETEAQRVEQQLGSKSRRVFR